MEAPRHWRLRKDRYSLRGEKIELEDGTIRVKLNGSSTWTEFQPNGRHEGENPQDATIIYQAPTEDYTNEQEPIPLQGVVEIPVSVD